MVIYVGYCMFQVYISDLPDVRLVNATLYIPDVIPIYCGLYCICLDYCPQSIHW